MTARRARIGYLVALALLTLVPMSLRAVSLSLLWMQGAYRNLVLFDGVRMGAGASALLCFLSVVSLIIDWCLMAGWIRGGDLWLAARATWIKCFALIAPLVSLWISVRAAMAFFGKRPDAIDAPIVAAHPWVAWSAAALQIVFAALVALLVITAVRAAQRGG